MNLRNVWETGVFKSGRKYDHTSLDKFRNKFRQTVDKSYIMHSKDMQVKDGIHYLPIYMTPFVAG